MTDLVHSPESAPAQRKPRDEQIDIHGLTHPGRVRAVNEDSFLICSLHRRVAIHSTSLPDVSALEMSGERLAFLSMVADGVGGAAMGEEASRLAVQRVTEYVASSTTCYYSTDTTDDTVFAEALQRAALRTHERILGEAQADPERRGMATTLTLWLGVWPRSYLLQVGDSRCYRFHQGELRQISRDQTMAQELVDQGILQPADADKSRWSHVLSSAIGGRETAPVVTRLDHGWGVVWLLCSDGLTKHVSDARIEERLAAMTPTKQVCEQLLEDALEDGGTDNITIVVGRAVKEQGAGIGDRGSGNRA
jgi:serine/threonine protein phosphatase PrpC